ncbi:hypothetical protein HJC23_012234 [Cyclotella cryptica]|uniref:Pericentrin/AKAP-450 centrosomal targeting domain-containing protein n=1 Tax=Cyclotella cryptica TaxID=29204 RepID=A0ABD3PLU0_9STRA|eukprot:CCRYP_013171-RA/>CCRYP_013171-RA protein AED:0.29 eAED:0.29 QI:147/1/1/1/1/1/2/447/1817
MDGWDDDDDVFDDIIHDETDVGTTAAATPGNARMPSSLQSFTQHHDLNLSAMTMTMTMPSPLSSEGAAAVSAGAFSAGAAAPLELQTHLEKHFENVSQEVDNGGNDGWSDDGVMEEEIVMSDAHYGDAPSVTLSDQAANNATSNDERADVSTPAATEGVLSRAAGVFGAALLASMEQDDGDDISQHNGNDEEEEEEEDESQQPHEGQKEASFRFGGGFVMKGLRGFIEAATTPQKNDYDDSMEEGADGWDDDEDLDLEDEEKDGWSQAEQMDEEEEESRTGKAIPPSIEREASEEPELQDEPSVHGERGGWDDFDVDVSFNDEKIKDDLEPNNLDISESAIIDGDAEISDANNNEVSDSLKDFVAKTESTLNSAFEDASKTPTRTPRDDFVREVDDQADELANADHDDQAVSKSLTDFVDTLDAELNELKVGLEENDVDQKKSAFQSSGVVSSEEVYNFDESKDNSPEPVDVGVKKLNMPHQDSWYLNAMEGGKGGLVYSDQNVRSNVDSRKDSLLPVNSGLTLNDVAPSERSPLGMPLSEMPSVENSENGSNADLSSTNGCNFQQSELQCKCLELILPLSESDKFSPVEESGFGTKTLPDGTTVLVNYEKLLQNEATKRILLQRSVETYERTMEKMQSKYHEALKLSQEREEARQLLDSQLNMAQHENLNLKALVAKLEKEMEAMKNETPSSETHLFQEELSASLAERDCLEKQVEILNEQLRLAHQQHSVDSESQEHLSRRLEETKSEQSRLEQLVQTVQSDLSEAQQTCSLLKSENHALQQELDTKNIEIATNEPVEKPDDSAAWKERIDALENELREKTSDCVALNDQVSKLLSEQATHTSKNEHLIKENDSLSDDVSKMRGLLAILENEKESLHSSQIDSEARIVELTAIVESMDNSTEEIDRLAAENASLTYELRMKSTENNENIASMKSLQTELDVTKARLLALEQTSSDHDDIHEIGKSLREENEVLKAKFANLQSDFVVLKQSKLELESSLEERTKCIEAIHAQVENLQTQASQAVHLQSEVADLRETLNRKERIIEELNTQLLDAQHSHAAIVSENEEQLVLSHGEVLELQSRIDEVERLHKDSIAKMEQQLASLMQRNSELTTNCDEYKDELERVQRETSETEAKYAEQVFKLEGENLELSAALKIAQDSLSSKQYLETNGAKLRVRELEEDAEVLHENIQSLVSTIEQLQQAKEDLIHENSKLVLALEGTASTDEIDQVRVAQESKELRTMIDQYQKAFSDAEQTISDLKVQIQALQESKDGGRNEFQSLFDDLSEEYSETKKALEQVQMEKGNLLARNRALEQDNKSLEFQLTETSSKSNQVLARNRELEQDNKSLEFQVKEMSSKSEKLEAIVASLEAQMKEQEKDALYAISQWEARCSSMEGSKNGQISHLEHASLLKERDRLEQEAGLLSEQVHALTTQLNSIETSQSLTSAEREKLLARIAELEEELKDENVNELRDELTSLQEERQQLDLDNEELLVQLGLMQQSKVEHEGELQSELTRLRGQVATLQDSIVILQRELDEARSTHASNDHDRISEVVERLHKENVDLQNNISRLGSEKSSLEDDINDLTKTIKSLEQQQHQQQQCNQASNNAEVLQLKAQVHDLVLKLADKEQEAASTSKKMRQELDLDEAEIQQLKSRVHDLELKLTVKEREAASTQEEMNQALKQKDDDILKLTTEGYLRETTLKDMTRQVEAKNAVDSIEVNFGVDKRETSAPEDEEKDYNDDDSLQDLLADDIESDDYLRHQIVILAQALERSELQRADALDRITRERKSNADSLRQLGESVKRFYSAMRCSDAV